MTRLLLTRPDTQRTLLGELTTACPQMTGVAELIRSFAALLQPCDHNAERLSAWIAAARAADLPHLHSFTRSLDLDKQAVTAALTHAYQNGGTERVNTKTKMTKRQIYGRAGFALLRHRILLG